MSSHRSRDRALPHLPYNWASSVGGCYATCPAHGWQAALRFTHLEARNPYELDERHASQLPAKSTGRGDHYNYTETPQRELTPATQAGAAPELVREPPSPDSASSFAGSPLCRVSRDNYIRRTSLHATKISRVSNTAMFATSDGSESITRHNATWIVSERHLYFTRTGGTGA